MRPPFQACWPSDQLWAMPVVRCALVLVVS
jgi:hypothetical protein